MSEPQELDEIIPLAEDAIGREDFQTASGLMVAAATILAGRDLDPSPMVDVAQVYATLEVAKQQRISNKLAVAQIDQLSAMAQTMPAPGYPTDPSIRVRDYLTSAEWAGLGE